jgi:holo-[acyl-carrier protein] synthase
MHLSTTEFNPHPLGVSAIGTDLVFLPRVRAFFAKYGQRGLDKLLTPKELAFCMQAKRDSEKIARIGSRIAIKEAVSKALGSGLSTLGHSQGVNWKEMEVYREEKQAPQLILSGKALILSDTLGLTFWNISSSHDGDYALAFVQATRTL